jgi:MFS transporter, DHA2 family, multidrug resistance protein
MAAPVLTRNFHPATIIAWGLLLSAVGFAVLTQLSAAHSPWLLLVGMLAFCIGLAPLGAITTDIVMTSVPPERAGAASAISETSFEFGGALGIAVLGSLLTAIYRGALDTAALTGIPPAAIESARDTLGGAVDAAQTLPAEEGARLLATARAAFVHAFEVTSALSAVCAVLAAIFAATLLRNAGQRR